MITTPTMLARNDDPETSKIAAFDIVASGISARMERLALLLITKFPNSTSRELEAKAILEVGQIRKRLRPLARRGLISNGTPKTCSRSGRKASTGVVGGAAE